MGKVERLQKEAAKMDSDLLKGVMYFSYPAARKAAKKELIRRGVIKKTWIGRLFQQI